MPTATAPGKIDDVQELGGECDRDDDPAQVPARATEHAARGACHLDQFGLAERATDWRGNNNIAESIIGQLAHETAPVAAWIVCGAGTGATWATIRYLRHRRLDKRLCVADSPGSAFAHGWQSRDRYALASPPTDRGERYPQTLFDSAWLIERGVDHAPWDAALRATLEDGRWHSRAGSGA